MQYLMSDSYDGVSLLYLAHTIPVCDKVKLFTHMYNSTSVYEIRS